MENLLHKVGWFGNVEERSFDGISKRRDNLSTGKY